MPNDEVAAKAKYRATEKGKTTAREYARLYYHKVLKFNKNEIASRKIRNDRNYYKRTFGITPEKAKDMRASGCALCGIKIGNLNIDHCHTTGRVRGVLCNPCNLMLGWLEKAKPKMEMIKQYLGEE